MHVPFDPSKVDWSIYLHDNDDESTNQLGGSYRVFHGLPYQRGNGIGSVFKRLLRYLIPLGKQAGYAIGRQGLESGQKILTNILAGKDTKEAVLNEGQVGLKNLLHKASEGLAPKQTGGSLIKYKKNRKTPESSIKRHFGLQNPNPNFNTIRKYPFPKSPQRKSKKTKRIDPLGSY